MKTSDIRARFLAHFEQRGHQVVPGSSLVPGNDPTLLFTNSGMVQFKEVFLGEQSPTTPRAVTAQRCVRAGGKHNDLENVGYTARHHTFFEMLGNFSFGDYFKSDAIAYAWELLTEGFGLPPDRLWVTVFEEDSEAEKIWRKKIGVPKNRLSRIGAADNFWSMGDTGPCGPCSEIFYDHGEAVAGGPPGSPEQDGDRFVEVWNLVFMQYNRAADGTLTPLPKPSVDTGMGLERIAAILQGQHNNYDIDLFRNLIAASETALGVDGGAAPSTTQSLRVIADHIRSTAFMLTDGVLPSNEGRGYVLRRIIRRAVRHGYRLGCRAPFMHKLVQPLVAEMGEAYPELSAAAAQVRDALRRENEKFNQTLEQGLRILDREIAELRGKVISGEVAFRLYDTFGFPLDLTADVAREHGLRVDSQGFENSMAQQRARARAAKQFTQAANLRLDGVTATEFLGYQTLTAQGEVVALLGLDDRPESDTETATATRLQKLQVGQRGIVVLNQTPFYPEGGGQVGDRGKISFGDAGFGVEDTRYLANQVIAHVGWARDGEISVGDSGNAAVGEQSRRHCANNHSATHLLHAALKAVLGTHVQQKGSLVTPQRLRFDFSHSEAITDAQLRSIEDWVNARIRANLEVCDSRMELEQAKAAGAEALFGEKYGVQVRVVRMGDCSLELCGGTHVTRSGDIGLFKITAESAVAAGIRRLEALSGACAENWVATQLAYLDSLAQTLKTQPARVGQKLETLLANQRAQSKQIQSLQDKLATGGDASEAVQQVNGINVVALRQDDADAKTLRRAVDQWKQKLGSGVVLVAGANADKVTLIAGVTADLAQQYRADALIAQLAPLVGGSGGGKPDLAQGGGGKPEALPDALRQVPRWVEQQG